MHFHFHHEQDVAGCVDPHPEWPDWVGALITTLNRMEFRLMATVQDSINEAAVVIHELVAAVSDLKAQAGPAVDTSALDAAVAKANAVLSPAPPAPADVPAQPAEVPVPTTDGTAPVQTVPSVPLA